MDCDYDPQASMKKELIENSKGKKKRKRKSLFAKAVSQPKPVFDPNDKTYEEYLDEYYKFDCEDIVGDIPCRFKYRKVVPNSFGLSIEEILTANDRELNKWCSLKKAIQIRPDHVEKYDQIAFEKKGRNINLKKRVLPSLFVGEEEEKEKDVEIKGKKKKVKKVRCSKGRNVEVKEEVESENKIEKESINGDASESKNEKKRKKKTDIVVKGELENNNKIGEESTNNDVSESKIKKKRKKKKQKVDVQTNVETNKDKKRKLTENDSVVPNKKARRGFKDKKQDVGITDARLSAYGINPKKFKNKMKYGKS